MCHFPLLEDLIAKPLKLSIVKNERDRRVKRSLASWEKQCAVFQIFCTIWLYQWVENLTKSEADEITSIKICDDGIFSEPSFRPQWFLSNSAILLQTKKLPWTSGVKLVASTGKDGYHSLMFYTNNSTQGGQGQALEANKSSQNTYLTTLPLLPPRGMLQSHWCCACRNKRLHLWPSPCLFW